MLDRNEITVSGNVFELSGTVVKDPVLREGRWVVRIESLYRPDTGGYFAAFTPGFWVHKDCSDPVKLQWFGLFVPSADAGWLRACMRVRVRGHFDPDRDFHKSYECFYPAALMALTIDQIEAIDPREPLELDTNRFRLKGAVSKRLPTPRPARLVSYRNQGFGVTLASSGYTGRPVWVYPTGPHSFEEGEIVTLTGQIDCRVFEDLDDDGEIINWATSTLTVSTHHTAARGCK